MSGILNGTPVTLINIYGPNFDDPSFFQTVLNRIPEVGDTNIILGGDFNCIIDVSVDKLSQKTPVNSKSSEALKNIMHNLNLIDIWRLRNPDTRAYSFFSPVHNSYSWIDFMLLDSNLIPNVVSSHYHNILISDHAPLSLDIRFKHRKDAQSWRFDNTILKDKSFLKFMSEKLPEIIATNDTGDVDDSTLWEAIKAVLRGNIISFMANRKKQSEKRLAELDESITELENSYQVSPDHNTLKSITSQRQEYNTILSSQVNKQLNRIKQLQFEIGDKPQKLLARQLRHIQASRAIHRVRSSSGTILTDPKEINTHFREFYSKLDKSNGDHDIDRIKSFLSQLNIHN